MDFIAFGNIAAHFFRFVEKGMFVGKLFAADERRRVRKPYYLDRIFGRFDRFGDPLLTLGDTDGEKKLDLEVDITTSSENLKTGFDSFDAFHEAEVLRLEADIVDLELSLEQSTPSEVIAPPTTMPSSKTSLKLVGIGALFVGGMLGCFAAFFLELLSQARIRAAETV